MMLLGSLIQVRYLPGMYNSGPPLLHLPDTLYPTFILSAYRDYLFDGKLKGLKTLECLHLFRVREKITLQSIALRFMPDLVDLIGLDRKRSLSHTEDSAREDRTKMA